MRISDWSSDVCSSDLGLALGDVEPAAEIDDLDARGTAHPKRAQSVSPSNTRVAAPLITIDWPSAQRMTRSPPGSETVTGDWTSPARIGATAAGPAPVPHARGSPPPPPPPPSRSCFPPPPPPKH